MPFRKANPDIYRFPRVDAAVIADLGGVEKRPAACLLASWLLGGATMNEKTVTTPKGDVVLPPGRTWGSLMSAQEDVLALVGARFSYQTMRTGVQTLRSAGIITDRYDPLPTTRGKYGSVFVLADQLLNPQTPINVSAQYVHRYYGDPKDFRFATAVRGVLDTGRATRRYRDVERFMQEIAAGCEEPAFVNIGRWRRGEVMDPTKPVFIPWFTIDIDRNYLREAWDDTQEIVQRIADIGFDVERTLVSFSGRRGFHIQIGADQIGCPIYADADAARIACDELTSRIAYGIAIDPSVNSPSQLIRVAGSRHDKSGLYKITWTLNDFQATEFEHAMDLATEPQPLPQVDPRITWEMDADIHDFFDQVSEDTESRYRALRDRTSASGGPGEVIRSILGGVGEGDTWHPRHEGRNKAAFILACWLLEDRPTGDADVDARRVADGPFEALVVWNKRNSPPMPERELWSAYGSAHRRINGSRPR